MRYIITLTYLFISSFLFAQAEKYQMEIWDADFVEEDGYAYIEVEVYNEGDTFKNPILEIFVDEIMISDPSTPLTTDVIFSKNTQRLKIPVQVPNNEKKGRLKVDIVLRNDKYSVSRKFKLKM